MVETANSPPPWGGVVFWVGFLKWFSPLVWFFFVFLLILLFAICIQLNWLEKNNKNAGGPKTLRKPKLYAKLVPMSSFISISPICECLFAFFLFTAKLKKKKTTVNSNNKRRTSAHDLFLKSDSIFNWIAILLKHHSHVQTAPQALHLGSPKWRRVKQDKGTNLQDHSPPSLGALSGMLLLKMMNFLEKQGGFPMSALSEVPVLHEKILRELCCSLGLAAQHDFREGNRSQGFCVQCPGSSAGAQMVTFNLFPARTTLQISHLPLHGLCCY